MIDPLVIQTFCIHGVAMLGCESSMYGLREWKEPLCEYIPEFKVRLCFYFSWYCFLAVHHMNY